MNLLTFKSAKDSRLAEVANNCATGEPFRKLLNEAIERLMIRGDFVGLVVPTAFCVRDQCITWPRYIGNIRKAVISGHNLTVQNNWYNFMGGPYARNCFRGCSPAQLIATGHAATYEDVKGENKKIRFYIDCLQDVGKDIVLRDFIDSNGQPLKELNSDGEWVYQKTLTLANQFVSTSEDIRTFGRVHLPEDIQCRVRVFAYDTVQDTLRDLAIYEPGETDPWYPRSKIVGSCSSCNNSCNGLTRFLAEAKLQFVPIVRDEDLVLITAIGALKNAFRAIRYEEQGDDGKAQMAWAIAVKELNLQLSDEQPDWTVPTQVNAFGGMSFSNQMI